jgi:membrane-associated phospholipid phosphatase
VKRNAPPRYGTARRIGRRLLAHFWLKSLGTTALMTGFFIVYFQLLRHPWGHVSTIPLTAVDRWIGFQPWALPLYLSLWVYVCAPAMLLDCRRELLRYAAGIGGVCAVGLGIFALWPTRIPPMQADYAGHAGFALLRGIDASGNACPSLHVASAVFAALALERVLPGIGLGRRWRWLSWAWCALIVYSTMAVKQHVLIDVACGALLGAAGALAARRISGAPGYDSALND